MKAISLVARERIEITDVDETEPQPGDLVIEPDHVGLCGTDLHVFLGQCEDRVAYPAVMGHEVGGRVIEIGEDVDEFGVGDRVVIDPVFPCLRCPLCRAGHFNTCLDVEVLGIDCPGALAERLVVPQDNVFHLPDSVESAHAIMAELYSVAVHSSRITRIETGDVVVILGAGRLGLSLLDVMRQSGAAEIISVDVLPSRLRIAEKIGADVVINSRETDPVEEIMERTGGLGADKVIEAVGHAETIPGRKPPMFMAAQIVRPSGQITAMGQGGSEEAFFWKPFVLKEATIVSSRLNLGDLPRALDLMASGLLHPQDIITDTIQPDEVQDGFERMHNEPESVIKVVVEMGALRSGG